VAAHVVLTGRLICRTPEERAAVRAHLDEHLRLTRAEPGCLEFEVTEDPARAGEWRVSERFADRAAFEAHQLRANASAWGAATSDVLRDYVIREE
jgi:quinol monooxygenase YgiN